jgi:L-fuconolactonase
VTAAIVDAHHHLWDPGRRAYPWMASPALDPIRRAYTVDDLRAAAGPDVASTILVQTVSDLTETEEFLATAEASGGYVAGVVGWVDLTADVPAQLAHLRTVPGGQFLVGLRHQAEDEPDPGWLLRPDVTAGIRAAGLVHDLLVRAPQRAAARSLAAALPDVPFVLDHAGKPAIADGEWDPWATWLTTMADLPNVTCKLSGLSTEASWSSWSADTLRPYADHVLACFGPDRVMFGSDWPVCELAGDYPGVLAFARDVLPEDSLTATARRVYGLTSRSVAL